MRPELGRDSFLYLLVVLKQLIKKKKKNFSRKLESFKCPLQKIWCYKLCNSRVIYSCSGSPTFGHKLCASQSCYFFICRKEWAGFGKGLGVDSHEVWTGFSLSHWVSFLLRQTLSIKVNRGSNLPQTGYWKKQSARLTLRLAKHFVSEKNRSQHVKYRIEAIISNSSALSPQLYT